MKRTGFGKLIRLFLFSIFPFLFYPEVDIQRFTGWYPFNPTLGQKIQTNVEGVMADAAYMAHFQISAANAVAGSATGVHAAIALASEAKTVSTGFTNPGCPKNITIKGNAAGIIGDVKVYGTNYADEVIDETLALNGATEVLGAKAFKTVTKVDLPAETHAGTDTVSIGFGEKLGLPYLLFHNTVIKSYHDNTLEGTAATVTVSATAIDGNTVDLNTALSGKVVDIYLIV